MITFIAIYIIIGIVFVLSISLKELITQIKRGDILEFTLTLILTTLLGAVAGLPAIPFYINTQRNRIQEEKDFKAELLREKPRLLNPGLFKLFLSLNSKIEVNHDNQTKCLNSRYSLSSRIVIPIIYDYQEIDHIILKGIRCFFRNIHIDFILIDSLFYIDDNLNSSNPNFCYDYLGNSNYSFRSSDHEISMSALSMLFNLPIDGINKLLIYDKSSPELIFTVNLKDYDKPSYRYLVDNKSLSEYVLQSEFELAVVEFLSLIWSKSKMEENGWLKDKANDIKKDLIIRYREIDKLQYLNIIEAILTKDFSPKLEYCLDDKSDKEIELDNKVAELSITGSVEEASNMFPTYDVNKIKSLRESKTTSILRNLSKDEGINFKSRIFLKSSIIVLELIGRDFEDFTSVVIGFSKFIEKETNLSVVEAIRSHLGIKMPDYYSSYCDDGLKYRFKNKKFSVDFNRSDKNGNYLPPGLGQTYISLSLLENNAILKNQSEISALGISFSKLRNKCAHPELVNLETLNDAEIFIAKLYVMSVFDEFKIIKNQLSN